MSDEEELDDKRFLLSVGAERTSNGGELIFSNPNSISASRGSVPELVFGDDGGEVYKLTIEEIMEKYTLLSLEEITLRDDRRTINTLKKSTIRLTSFNMVVFF